ncbi:MAG: threonylcarbamoyl-AMP synthase, partial [Opitutaceae bacterium]|nr:threonylcarbamoyl-AMP synthase [Opitutaceae bacterium]
MARRTHSIATRIYRGTPRNIALLARALQRGELVAVPTETVYGLAGNALSTDACAAIFRAKGRPANDPLIVHVYDLAQLDRLAHRNPAVEKLARAFWPGPLTLVLPKKDVVPDSATSGLPSVAIRMPAHPVFRALLKKCGLPLVAPSANPFGYISPTCAGHVRDGLRGKIRHILDGGDCAIGLESTIVDLRDPRRPAILRPGKIGAGEIARVLRVSVDADVGANANVGVSVGVGAGVDVGAGVRGGAGVVAQKKHRAGGVLAGGVRAALAPGMLTKHYSPRTPVVLHARLTRADIAGIPRDEAVMPLFAAASADA